jgi:hypothetical protein
MVRCVSEWPSDPHHDWPQHFRVGDVVRLTDGRPAVVRAVQDYAPDPPSRWDLIVSALDRNGFPDTFIVEPWDCCLDPTVAQGPRHRRDCLRNAAAAKCRSSGRRPSHIERT